jgi:hypothetical protein
MSFFEKIRNLLQSKSWYYIFSSEGIIRPRFLKRSSGVRKCPYWGLFANFSVFYIYLKVSWSLSKSYNPKLDKIFFFWRLWASNEPVVSGNAHDGEFLLIFQFSIVFWMSPEDSQSILIPNKVQPKIFGDSEPKTSQLCLAMFILRTFC